MWFKTHHGFTTDKKFALVAHELKLPKAFIIAIAVELLEYASSRDDRGNIEGLNEEEIAFNLGIEVSVLRNALRSLCNRRFCNKSHIINWERYQGRFDSTNAERQRKFRNKKKQSVISDVTDNNTLCNGVTLPDKIRGDKIREERTGNKEKEEKEKSPKFELLNDIPAGDWKDYVEMRQRIGKPMTQRAKEMAIEKLLALKAKGFAPSDVLQQSVFNSWQGLFSIKEEFYAKRDQSGNGKSKWTSEGDRLSDRYKKQAEDVAAESAIDITPQQNLHLAAPVRENGK